MSAASDQTGGAQRKDPIRRYVWTLIALLALLVLTAALALMPLGGLNSILSITIAIGKALLVMGIFMHESKARQLTRLASSLGFIWLSALIGLMLLDFLTRVHVPIPWP
jgi:cytochrome c oxidase subunit 4